MGENRGRFVDDLVALLRELCRAPGAEAAARLGTPRPSELAERFIHVEPTNFAAFRAVELLPWSEDAFGIALPELAESGNWPMAELADAIGPLQAGPRVGGSGPCFQGFFEDPKLPARAAVYLTLSDDGAQGFLEELRIRIESVK